MELLKGKRFLALRSAVAIGAGLLLGFSLGLPFWIGLALAGASILPVLFLSERFLYLTLLFLAFSYARVSLPSPIPDDSFGHRIAIEGKLEGKTGEYSVVKIDEPQALKDRKVLVYLTRDEEPGTRYEISGKLLRLAFPRNPGLSDRNQRLTREGVIGRIYADEVRIQGEPKGIRAFLNEIRESLIERNQELFRGKSGLYTAILLGERGQVTEELYADMRRTGTLHLLAVSGLHVGVLVAFLFLLMRFLHIPRKVMLPVLALILLFYIGLVGPRASILRASVMSLAVAVGFAFQRKILPLNSLAVAATLILLVRPTDILSLGFQLSFAAASGIILAASGFRELQQSRRRILHRLPKQVIKWIALPLTISAAATLFTMPILAANFHKITFGPILANLPILPLISLLLPLGLVSLGLSLIWLPLGKLLGWSVFGGLWAVEKLLEYLPGTLIKTGPWPVALVAGIFLAVLILHTEQRSKRRFALAGIVLLIGANIGIWPWALESRKPCLSLLDTYHGNVSVLESDGHAVLLNPGSVAEFTVSDFLASRGIRRIDYVMCLSQNAGDLSGLDSIQANFEVKNVGSVLKSESPIPRAGMLLMPSCTLSYDLASREYPYYEVKSGDTKVVFTSETWRIDCEAKLNYLLSKYLQPFDCQSYMVSKEGTKQGETYVIREQGGLVLRL